MSQNWEGVVKKESEGKYVIPREFRDDMRVPGVVFASHKLLPSVLRDNALEQVVNVATLPGIIQSSIALPDIHYGYGFPIGGVAATSLRDGVISPGGVGFDINCGVRLLRTNLERGDVAGKAGELAAVLFSVIPCGVGSKGDIRPGEKNIKRVLEEGVGWAVKNGYGWREDIEFCEENGCMEGAEAGELSKRAVERGLPQLGTLGSGNHFIEVQYVEEVFDNEAARVFGLSAGQVVVMIHSGSRGLGAQVCQDSISMMRGAAGKYGFELPDRQLSCAPVDSPEGKKYFAAMAAAANYAWANRQCLMHLVRQAFERVFGTGAERLGMSLVYDVAHNIAKLEVHEVDGKRERVCVHRKGATRALPAGHPLVPKRYAGVGQPVLVPGDMGRASYVMRGMEAAMRESFGSVCHGAGRLLSRTAAKQQFNSRQVMDDLEERGIKIQAANRKVMVEEAPGAYKDVSLVVDSCERAGLAERVAKLRPMAVVKG
ncbi:MAG: RtcB family protein [bacterium]